jgi:hypothetical protein
MHSDKRAAPADDRHLQEPALASRRAFVKRAAYVAPAIVTLKAAPAFAKKASRKPGRRP